MSRFNTLLRHLRFPEALSIYLKVKKHQQEGLRISSLKQPFSLRDNPYDYATFEEVLVRQTYQIDLGFSPTRIIDGGGNIGLTAAYFASRYPAAKIITVEPDPNNFELLKKNTAGYPNITALNTGLWSSSASLVVRDLGLGDNGFVVEEVDPSTPGSLRAVSIGDIMQQQQWDTIDLLKLDVEGAEKEIFSSNTESWLPKTKVLVIELHDEMKKGASKAVFAALNQYDFSFSTAGENVIFRSLAL